MKWNEQVILVTGGTGSFGRKFVRWDEYFSMLHDVLRDPAAHALTAEQRDAAWNYGYRFFFEYPYDFPWRLMHFWKDLAEWPVGRVLSDEGRTAFGKTFDHLAGDSIEWRI